MQRGGGPAAQNAPLQRRAPPAKQSAARQPRRELAAQSANSAERRQVQVPATQRACNVELLHPKARNAERLQGRAFILPPGARRDHIANKMRERRGARKINDIPQSGLGLYFGSFISELYRCIRVLLHEVLLRCGVALSLHCRCATCIVVPLHRALLYRCIAVSLRCVMMTVQFKMHALATCFIYFQMVRWPNG